MGTPASISRHPEHTMLVIFPIALWFSLFCDFAAMTSSAPERWSIAALYAMVGALAAAVPAFINCFYYGVEVTRCCGRPGSTWR